MMDERKYLVDGVNRRRRIYDDSWLTSERCDETQAAVQMHASFVMDGDPVGTCFNQRGNELVRTFDHEMTVERDTGGLAETSDHGGADGEIGDNVAVHDVHVENRGSAFHGGLRFCAEASEVSGKNGWSKLNHEMPRWPLWSSSKCFTRRARPLQDAAWA
jgi:hypothetical protein